MQSHRRIERRFAAAAVAAVCFVGLRAQGPQPPADLVLRGGRVITLTPDDRVAEAIAVRGNQILSVGSDTEVRRFIGPKTRVIELRGRGVTPGFIDAHTHTEHTAEFLRFWVDVHSPPLPSTAAIIGAVRERTKIVPPGTWVIGQGTFGQPMPTPEELTEAFPDHPVVLRWSRHQYVVNKRALEVSGITRTTPDPQGGKIERGPNGEPTGMLHEAFDMLKIPPYPQAELKSAIEQTLRDYYLKQGVTSVYDMPGNQAIPYWALHDEGKLAVRMRISYTMWPGSQSQMDLDSFLKSGLRPGMGDEWLKVGSVKLFIDGVDENFKTPIPTLMSHVKRINAAGFQVLMHATSTRAQDMALDAIEAALKDTPRPDARHRIEHLGGTLDRPRLERATRLGAIVVPTPGGIQGGGGGQRGQSGQAPARNPYHSLIAMGLRPPGNSDTAGTRTEMIDPMLNLYLLVTRVNNRQVVVNPEERLSVMDALRVYTIFSAFASFEEKIKGTLEAGKLADLVILSENPLTIAPERLKDIRIDVTVIDGMVKYERARGLSHQN